MLCVRHSPESSTSGDSLFLAINLKGCQKKKKLLSTKHPLKIAELPLILSATTFEWGFSQFGNSVLFQPFSRLARTPKQCADRGNGKKLG